MMSIVTVVLVHHAAAVGPDVDPQRPLSTRGHEQALRVAASLEAAGCRPQAIWHSGKLRARQTAETMWRVCQPMAEFKMVRGVRPDDPPGILCDALRRETRDVMVVGHRPNIGLVLQMLLGGRALDVPLHGAVAVTSEDDGVTWRESYTVTPGV